MNQPSEREIELERRIASDKRELRRLENEREERERRDRSLENAGRYSRYPWGAFFAGDRSSGVVQAVLDEDLRELAGEEYFAKRGAQISAAAEKWADDWPPRRSGWNDRAPKHTPARWEQLTGIKILDPDGWRSPNEKSMDEPIDRDEWERRVAISTISSTTVNKEYK